jgi:hypothetical protein
MATLNYRELGVREVEDGKIEFEVLPEHVKLLRSAKVKWNGAPTIDPMAPYGLPDLFESMRYILEDDDNPSYESTDLNRFHQGTALALQIAIVTGKFKAGVFRAPKYTQDWKEFRPKKEKNNENHAATVLDAVEADTTND